MQNPATLPLWLAGLGFLLGSAGGARYRALGWMFAGALALLLASAHAKPEYLGSAYVLPFAAGGVALERWTSRPALVRLRWALALLLAAGLGLAPAVVPVLPVERYVRWARALGVEPSTAERKQLGRLPQFFADMLGWEEKAEAVARVYRALPPQERSSAAVFADNYGRSGALDFFGRKLGLPPALGRHNSYWIWGPRGASGEVVIILGGDLADKQAAFESVEVAGRVTCADCMPYESDLDIYVGRRLRSSIGEVWPRLKHYD